jgi:predicted transposase/invertase (TIGR01784 family)
MQEITNSDASFAPEAKKQPKNKDNSLQGNMYDKLFKENMRETLPGVIEHILKLDIVTIEELKDDIQYTKERKTDLLKKVSDAEGNKFVLHVEYQTDDYPKMQFRMAEYSIMLQRKYDLPVSQFVIYIGPGKPNMPTTINTKDHKFRYNLKALSSVNYSLFLKSDKIEERMLAILGKMEPEESIPVLERILIDIKQTAEDSLSTDRYVQQLHVLVKLRNLGQNLEEVMMTIAKFFKEEEDLLYRMGQERATQRERAKAEKEKKEMAIVLKNKNVSIDIIVEATGLTVKEIQAL